MVAPGSLHLMRRKTASICASRPRWLWFSSRKSVKCSLSTLASAPATVSTGSGGSITPPPGGSGGGARLLLCGRRHGDAEGAALFGDEEAHGGARVETQGAGKRLERGLVELAQFDLQSFG